MHFYFKCKNVVFKCVETKYYCIFLNTPCPRISCAPHFLRRKNLKIFKNVNFTKNLIFFSNICAHNTQFLNLNTLFFVFPLQLQPLLSRFWCLATRKWYALMSQLCYCIIFKLYFQIKTVRDQAKNYLQVFFSTAFVVIVVHWAHMVGITV
jgi:hypothetical protein